MEKEFLYSIIDSIELFIILWDTQGNILKFNKHGEAVTGFSEEEVQGEKWTTLFSEDDNRTYLMDLMNNVVDKKVSFYENKVICKDGKTVYILWNNIILFDKNENPINLVSIGIDITERKEAEKKLQLSYEELEAVYEELTATEEELKYNYSDLQQKEEELKISEERYRLALEGSRDAIWDWDILRGKSFVSDRWREMLGYDPQELEVNHLTWKDLLHPEDKERAFKAQRDHLDGKTPFYTSEYRLKTKSGKYKWISVRGKALRDKDGKPIRIAGSQTDISERKDFEEKINNMAFYDSLTGLPNRALFEKILRKSLEESLKYNLKGAVLFLDLDNFKTVNDTYGHFMGDDLLKNVAEILKSFEKDKTTISRFGGDEFVIMIHDVKNDEEVSKIALEIVKSLSRTWLIGGKEFYSTVSVGIAFYPGHGCDVQSILSNADVAMYSVKKAEKDNFRIYSCNMNSQLVERVNMESSLRHALKDNEFILHYQPQIDQKTGRLVGAEALVRWNNPELGMIPPNDFIPLAEETGLIIPLGEWVLREACRQNKEWQDLGYTKIPVSVNFSANQLKQPDLVDKVKAVLQDTGLEPRWLYLEVTESIAIADIEFAVKVLNDLKEIGVSIALDDFGTGYSSLSYLKKLPVNVIKIDKSFVDEINESEHAAAITEAIIFMSHKMNIKVIAEGVETISQHLSLQQGNCDMAQGYLFSRPLPSEGIERLIAVEDCSLITV